MQWNETAVCDMIIIKRKNQITHNCIHIHKLYGKKHRRTAVVKVAQVIALLHSVHVPVLHQSVTLTGKQNYTDSTDSEFIHSRTYVYIHVYIDSMTPVVDIASLNNYRTHYCFCQSARAS